MDEQNSAVQPVKVFISYSWDSDEHREWVRKFATQLRADGIDVTLDRWHAVPGDQLPQFMERAVRESNFVLCICTPKYKEKSDQRGGGVGYEGDVMTDEAFVYRNQRKFIPVLRRGEWKESAPSWLLGKYYIDLRGDPYSEQNYNDLLTALRNEREEAPPIGGVNVVNVGGRDTFEFVNREIELATLDPTNLDTAYWQYALVSAPAGYGKSRLMKRLIRKIEENPDLSRKWNHCYIDLQACSDPEQVAAYVVREATGEPVQSDMDTLELKKKVCSHILDNMSVSTQDGSLRHVLLIIDSIDYLSPTTSDWISSVIHDVVVDSYIDYEKDTAPFSVRVILSGVDTETFWQNYQKWETSARYRLKAPKKLSLSAFDDLAVQELVKRRAVKDNVSLGTDNISDISYELQFLSGGHPQVVSEILDELAVKKFRKYREYLRDNRERLIRNHVSTVARKILSRFPVPQAQKEIKTICVFRLINLNTLKELRDGKLVSSQVDIALLGQLCANKILNPPSGETFFYHDDIIRRILSLDLAFGDGRDDSHVQSIHGCARKLYHKWIKASHYSFHLFFVEWLFHSLQITELSNDDIIAEWKSLISSVQTETLPLDALKHAIYGRLKKDNEVRYLFRERFGSDDFSQLFDA